MIWLLIGASGTGKTSLGNYLKGIGIPELISTSTRLPRAGESNGNPYFFVNQEQFNEIPMIEKTIYNGNSYGTSVAEVESKVANRRDCFAIVDRHGIEEFRKLYGEQVSVIFVYAAPGDVYDRMLARGDKIDDIYQRITHAENTGEFNNLGIADYCLVNKNLDDAERQLKEIVGLGE